MRVARLFSDPFSDLPVVLLVDETERIRVTLDVGVGEAPAIASELAGVKMSRPSTHDLLAHLVESCGGQLERIELSGVREDVVFAKLVLLIVGGGRVEVDARPADAVALALRTGTRIRVARKVVEWSRRITAQRGPIPQATSPLVRDPIGDDGFLPEPTDDDPLAPLAGTFLLESLADEDFGKWKM
jgi:hypothetical protein